MKEKKIRELLVKKTKKIEKLYLNISPFFEMENIHQFRTSTKQLRAFSRLLNEASGNENLNLSNKFKHSYHISGRIRDTQILQMKIVDQWKAPVPVFYEYLNEALVQFRTAWEVHFRAKGLGEIFNRKKATYFVELSKEQFRDVFIQRIDELQKLISSPSNENLHEARKKIKDMLYNFKMAKKEWDAGVEALHGLPVFVLEELAHLLGEFNDSNLIHKQLSSFKSPSIQEIERKVLNDLIQVEWEYHLIQKEKLLDKLKSFLFLISQKN